MAKVIQFPACISEVRRKEDNGSMFEASQAVMCSIEDAMSAVTELQSCLAIIDGLAAAICTPPEEQVLRVRTRRLRDQLDTASAKLHARVRCLALQ